jgi:hypothetical protein
MHNKRNRINMSRYEIVRRTAMISVTCKTHGYTPLAVNVDKKKVEKLTAGKCNFTILSDRTLLCKIETHL